MKPPKKKHTLIFMNLSGFDVTTSPQFHQGRYGKIYRLTFEGNTPWLISIIHPLHQDPGPCSESAWNNSMSRIPASAKRPNVKTVVWLVKRSAHSYFTKKTIWKILKTVCRKYISNYSIVAETWHLDFRCAAYTVYIKVHQPNSINFLGMLRFRDLFVGCRAIDSINVMISIILTQ